MKKETIGYVLVGAAALLLLTRRQGPASQGPGRQNIYSYPPPNPPVANNAAAWANWARTIMDLYGDVSQLWQPGGPFHRQSVTNQQAQWIANGISQAGWDASSWLAQGNN
jgi:hypothetical protein